LWAGSKAVEGVEGERVFGWMGWAAVPGVEEWRQRQGVEDGGAGSLQRAVMLLRRWRSYQRDDARMTALGGESGGRVVSRTGGGGIHDGWVAQCGGIGSLWVC
jgi:hypothetical protein